MVGYCKVTIPLFIGAFAALALVHLEVSHNASPKAPSSRTSRILAPVQALHSPKANTAFIIVKGKAATDAFVRLVHKRLRSSRIEVIRRGRLAGHVIDADDVLSSSYGRIHEAAYSTSPSSLLPTAAGLAAFAGEYGNSWSAAKATAENAADALTSLSITPEELHAEWMKKIQHVKLSASATVGMCKGTMVINGYYPALAESFVNDGIYYLEVSFKPERLPYQNFSSQVIGGRRDPANAAVGSLQYALYRNWEQLGLAAQPDVLNNGILTTDSALMGWLAPVGWLDRPIEHPFYFALAARDVDVNALMTAADFRDITFEGQTGSLFDHVAGLDRTQCLDKLAAMFPV